MTRNDLRLLVDRATIFAVRHDMKIAAVFIGVLAFLIPAVVLS